MKLISSTLTLSFMALLSASAVTANIASADETLSEKAKEAGNDTRRGVKSGARAVKDKACEMVNGKMECAVQKTKHTLQDGADKVEDAVD